VAAQGDRADFCAEPNDEYQQACDVPVETIAAGRLFHANDADIYRVIALDFGAQLRAELVDMPFPYRITVADWTGKPIVVSADGGTGQVVEAALPLPGAYYVVIDSRYGEFTDDTPYHFRYAMSYPSGVMQPILSFSAFENALTFETPRATVTRGEGRFTIALKNDGTERSPAEEFILVSRGGNAGLTIAANFVLSVDARAVAGSVPGFGVEFRSPGTFEGYRMIVNAVRQQIKLDKSVKNVKSGLADWKDVPSIDPSGANRLAVRAIGSRIECFVNGEQVIAVDDESFSEGRMTFGAVSWADPSSVRFDNLLVVAK
jgi:hypothetical protein